MGVYEHFAGKFHVLIHLLIRTPKFFFFPVCFIYFRPDAFDDYFFFVPRFQDDDEEDVTVSPRVLSPEMDEPAGSFHVRGFHGRCKEPQEKRTAFIALGNLNNLRSSANRLSFATDEHPATLRAKQLVQQIHG